MDDASKAFLFELLETPSPTGDEGRVQRLLHRRLAPYADRVEVDAHGNLYLWRNPAAERRVMIAAHCDQIGFLVTEIDAKGYLHVEPLGGLDEGVVPGGRVTIHAKDGPVAGVFGRRAIHLQTVQERGQAPVLSGVWIDIGATDREDAARCVQLGDYATYALDVLELRHGRVAAPGLDDKAGLWVMAEAFRRLRDDRLAFGLVAVSTVQEEVGLRGAAAAALHVRPEVGIAVDVTHATDDPGVKPGMLPCRLGGGPAIPSGPSTSPVVGRLLVEAARRHDIPYQPTPMSSLAGNDAKELQVAGGPAAAVGIGIPNRNMHTQVEVCALDDLEHTARLLVEFLRSLRADTDFRPYRLD
jgi:endoglucanase